MKKSAPILVLILSLILSACTPAVEPTVPPTGLVQVTETQPAVTALPTIPPSLPTITPPQPTPAPTTPLFIRLGEVNEGEGITLETGGDVDSQAVTVGDPPETARATGNGQALASADGNTIPDIYLQFQVDDRRMFAGQPSPHLLVEVEYLDLGTDRFSIQYDALSSNTSDGLFAGGGAVAKTNSGEWRTARFNLCNANFANRTNGGDFRLSDEGDGAEIIRKVTITFLQPGAATILVDDFGANPFDDLPDSDAIQTALDLTCSGETVLFTSGVNTDGYRGYLIDKTLFLTGMSAKKNLTFTSTDPDNHALLKAAADLKGFVARLYARTRLSNAGEIDDIRFANLDVNGNREERICFGKDFIANGVDDNWGSWLPECSEPGDPWCSPGNLSFDGGQWIDMDYENHPERWTTGVIIENVVNSQTECGTALGFGNAASIIRNVTIDTAGDHVHAAGCALTDNDEPNGGWSDGITMYGPAHQVIGNTIINPTDIGIVTFGGKDNIIAGNTIRITSGNYGAFGGIAVHSWMYGDNSGLQIVNNQVISEGDTRCGGLHAGINIGGHMWGGGCTMHTPPFTVGNRGTCVKEPQPPQGAFCDPGDVCQVWTYIPPGGTLTMRGNTVSGAHINYLVEGLDGELVDEDNVSLTPRMSDWEAARRGCDGLTWGPLDRVAHHPAIPGWLDLRVHCER